MSAIDDVLEKYRDAFGVRDDRANELHKKACVELAALRAELESICRVRDELSIELYEAKKFHPRAMKLITKKKNFVVVADDEEYFIHVYATIRKHEKEKGTWTGYDEIEYADCYRKIIGEPTEEECRSEMTPSSKIGSIG